MTTPASKLREMQKNLLSAQQVLQPLGINVSEYIILAAVGEDRGNDPPRTAQEIAGALIMHAPAAHVIVTTLEKQELVKRAKMLRYVQGRGRRYSKVVLITDLGRWTLEEATKMLEMLLEETFDESAR